MYPMTELNRQEMCNLKRLRANALHTEAIQFTKNHSQFHMHNKNILMYMTYTYSLLAMKKR